MNKAIEVIPLVASFLVAMLLTLFTQGLLGDYKTSSQPDIPSVHGVN